MGLGGQRERRNVASPRAIDRRGAVWSLPDGSRLPNGIENTGLVLGDPDHPARLQVKDLENPDDFHNRLKSWLLKQG